MCGKTIAIIAATFAGICIKKNFTQRLHPRTNKHIKKQKQIEKTQKKQQVFT